MKLVPNVVSTKLARSALQLDKSSPKLLFGAGVVSMIGSTVLACRGTLKLHEVLEEAQSDLNTAKTLDSPQYSEKDRQKDITLIYTRGVVGVVKLYAPAVLLGVAGISMLSKSNNILEQRNVALTAAYTAIDKAFSDYRGRVVEKYGPSQDDEFRYAGEVVTIEDEKGKPLAKLRVGPEGASMYARFFDEYSANWSKEPEYNRVFLICQQNYANDMLKARGHLFLNEVYRMLGLDDTTAGAVVGWVISHEGDNFVDFGIFDNPEDQLRDFVNGREGSILLDFNVDGIIYDKIDKGTERIGWQR